MDTLETITFAQPDLDAIARSRLQLLDSLKEGIYRIDEQGLCVFMNRAAGSMLGYGLGEARGKPMRELHNPCLSGRDNGLPIPPLDCSIHEAQHEPGHVDRRDIFLRRDGTTFPVEWSLHPLFESGLYRGAVITFSDITERLKDERHLQLQYDVSRILGSAAAVEEAAPEILKSICETLELDYAWFWEMGGSAHDPTLVNTWRRAGAEFPPLEPDRGMASKAMEARAPLWISGCAGSDPMLHSGFAIPLCLGGRAIGVMEFITREARAEDADILKTMTLLADTIAQFVERRRAEQAQSRLIAILEATTDFVGVAVDLEGKILSVNKAVEKIFGYLPGELLGQPLTRLIPDYQELLHARGPADRRRRIRGHGAHRSGRSISIELSLGECVENGRRILTFIIADTTGPDAREEALRSQTRLVELIVSSMGDGVIVANEKFELLMVNPAAKRLIPLVRGINSVLQEEPMLNGPEPWVYSSDGATPLEWNHLPLVRAIRGESVDNAEILLHPPNSGEGTWVSETSRPLVNSAGRPCGGVVISRDITGQKASADALRRAKEEAESANRAKSEFLSRMSHELRTPMNAILGFAQLLELDPLTEQQMDGVARMLRAGRHLLSLINEVLDLSRIEAGRLSLENERVDPYEMMQAALELIRPLMEQRSVRLVYPPPLDGPCHLVADPQRLTQVFLNLLSNAVKYNREGGSVTLSFSRESPTRPGQLRIGVADTGEGIAPDDLKKLFVPFERLAADRTAVEGTGLGLALSEHLISLMHGTMGVKSTLGEGSEFWVDMPLSEEPVDTPEASAEHNSPTRAVHLNSLLYIEDNAANIELVETILSRIPGFRLTSAKEGRLGLAMAREQLPELILLDVALPDMNGLEVLRDLQRSEPTRAIPVVIVTADTREKTRHDLIAAGARACITKPIRVQEFLDAITGIISRQVPAEINR